MSLRGQSRLYYKISVVGSILIVLGMAVVLSSSTGYALSKSGNPAYYFERHVVWLLLGGLAMLFVGWIGLKKLADHALFIFIVSLGLLLIPVFTGTLRWIVIGPLSFQPGELVKLTFIIFLADFLRRRRDQISKAKVLAIPVGFFLLITGILQLQRDLGTCVVLFLAFALLLFLAGLPKRYIAVLCGAGAVMAVGLVLLFPYRVERIKTYLNPSLDPQGKGYQVNQSKLALGMGGLFGKGFGVGRQKLKYLPEAHKDYVYAIVGEELGLVGTSVVLFLFAVLTFSGLELALRTKDEFAKFLAAGISGLFGFQFLLHASVVLSLIPSKGTTLPFFSVGGSAVLIDLIALGILLQMARDTCFLSPLDDLEGHSLLTT